MNLIYNPFRGFMKIMVKAQSNFNILFFLILALFFSCSERRIADPPVLGTKWVTVYDNKAEGISKEWYLQFPGGNISGSTWDDWQIKNARYRWHRQTFLMGKADSLSLYLLKCSTVAGKNLIWINGNMLPQLEVTALAVLDISPYLKDNSYNDIVVRSEYQPDAFGINRIEIIKGSPDSLKLDSRRDYRNMPLYHTAPSYLSDLIIYQADIRNMSAAGDFVGFQNTISRLDQLGVNMVWFRPLHPIGIRGRIGKMGSPYAVKDHFACNPDYGEQNDFNIMAAMLKRYKMRIMLEMVPSQSAVDHAWTADYPDYYMPAFYAASRDIRKFNFDNKRVHARIMSYFDYWLERGVDAFCCYDSHFIPGLFWEDLRDHFAETAKEPLLMADCNDAELMLNGFNILQGNALYEAFVRIVKNKADASEIGKVLALEAQIYPEGTRILHYAEHHGSERAAGLLGYEDHHLALFTIFTAPGIPMLYSGEELINPPRSSLYDKSEMNWFNIHWPTYNLISRLTKLRKSSPVLTRGDFSQIADTKAVGGFTRRYRNETWFVLMNYSNTEQIYQCDVKSTVFSDGSSGVTRNGRVLLRPKGYCIVK
ncbi:MAG: alpha-amylase family glycosyl hydrolase [Candidatus Marinimicrobia bacterium]|nr:alpha-amylase family glycosyl hydrolase [Candidatus Neomarinimicrobiota bacterium]MDD5709784.1 alpha-amylase family glycosyl hydrolase [Candidatus Neomarinimicrobiota bacterium]